VLRLERELEGWKGLRFDHGSVRAPRSLRVPSSGMGSVRGRREGSAALEAMGRETSPAAGATPSVAVQSRVARRVSHTKGFL
jgi:hypothetical protein